MSCKLTMSACNLLTRTVQDFMVGSLTSESLWPTAMWGNLDIFCDFGLDHLFFLKLLWNYIQLWPIQALCCSCSCGTRWFWVLEWPERWQRWSQVGLGGGMEFRQDRGPHPGLEGAPRLWIEKAWRWLGAIMVYLLWSWGPENLGYRMGWHVTASQTGWGWQGPQVGWSLSCMGSWLLKQKSSNSIL